MQQRCRFHKEIMLLKEKQLSLKKKIAKKWLKTEEGKMLVAWLGADNINQGHESVGAHFQVWLESEDYKHQNKLYKH